MARFTPLRDDLSIKLVYKPIIQDNITSFKVLNDDEHIVEFITNLDLFKDVIVDEEHEQYLEDETKICRINLMPKGVVTLEKLYHFHNCFKGPPNTKTQIFTLRNEQLNLGTEQDPKHVNLSTYCTREELKSFI